MEGKRKADRERTATVCWERETWAGPAKALVGNKATWNQESNIVAPSRTLAGAASLATEAKYLRVDLRILQATPPLAGQQAVEVRQAPCSVLPSAGNWMSKIGVQTQRSTKVHT